MERFDESFYINRTILPQYSKYVYAYDMFDDVNLYYLKKYAKYLMPHLHIHSEMPIPYLTNTVKCKLIIENGLYKYYKKCTPDDYKILNMDYILEYDEITLFRIEA